MTQINHPLFDAFREDHAVLGRGLHELRSLVQTDDIMALKTAAQKLDQAVGAHIAFEEEDFYPALQAFLSRQEVEQMYAEHAHGAETLVQIAALDDTAKLDDVSRNQLLDRIDEMEKHVSECGELFGALGGLDEKQKSEILEKLIRWREVAPIWTEYAQEKPDNG
ncbi:hemerythrin domain-containing protein [Parasphingorhabdus sp.]|uniref:hemerythrin domain-containing protein n=1 Tax=Parasphingorhabdus sp. TaxID=2709688 RepID=UPI003A950EF7